MAGVGADYIKRGQHLGPSTSFDISVNTENYEDEICIINDPNSKDCSILQDDRPHSEEKVPLSVVKPSQPSETPGP